MHPNNFRILASESTWEQGKRITISKHKSDETILPTYIPKNTLWYAVESYKIKIHNNIFGIPDWFNHNSLQIWRIYGVYFETIEDLLWLCKFRSPRKMPAAALLACVSRCLLVVRLLSGRRGTRCSCSRGTGSQEEGRWSAASPRKHVGAPTGCTGWVDCNNLNYHK